MNTSRQQQSSRGGSSKRRRRTFRQRASCTTLLLCSLMLQTTTPCFSFLPLQSQSQQHARRPSYGAINHDSTTALSATPQLTREQEEKQRRATGIAVLLTVPLAWGTYTPVVKFLYAVEPPVPGFVFSAAYYLVAAISLWTVVTLQRTKQVDTAVADIETDIDVPASSKDNDAIDRVTLLGGIELGSYLFIGNGLQIVGLQTVPADRAGFLVQLTTVIVPLLQATLSGTLQAVPLRTWIACLIAFAGVVIMDLEGVSLSTLSQQLQSVTSTISRGDLLILLSAVVYSFHVVRLSVYATRTTPSKLAASKATVETVLSAGLVLVLASMAVGGGAGGDYARQLGNEINTYFTNMSNLIMSGNFDVTDFLPAIGAVLWTGWVTCAYTIYAQSFGQNRVSSIDANLIYTAQPLFTALFAYLLIGETLTPTGVLGGSIIAFAVYSIASDTQSTE